MSQGATRAAALVREFPERYTRLVSMGAPTEVETIGLDGLRGAVLMVGERERKDLMSASEKALQRKDVPATSMIIPDADHAGMGPRPEETMGEVLDWLAVDFMEHGWSQKHLIRTIMSSAVYQQSSRTTEELVERDPGNRLLARGPRFRLEAEVLRDTALAGKEDAPVATALVFDNSLRMDYEQENRSRLKAATDRAPTTSPAGEARWPAVRLRTHAPNNPPKKTAATTRRGSQANEAPLRPYQGIGSAFGGDCCVPQRGPGEKLASLARARFACCRNWLPGFPGRRPVTARRICWAACTISRC